MRLVKTINTLPGTCRFINGMWNSSWSSFIVYKNLSIEVSVAKLIARPPNKIMASAKLKYFARDTIDSSLDFICRGTIAERVV